MSPASKEMFDVLYEEQDLVEAADVDGLTELQQRKREALERLLAEGETDELDAVVLRSLATTNIVGAATSGGRSSRHRARDAGGEAMSKHKLCPAPPPRCIHVYAQGWACKRLVERDGLCRVHHPGLPQLALVPDVVEVSEPEVELEQVGPRTDEPGRNEPDPVGPVPMDITGDERAAIALLALFVEQTEGAEVEGIPLGHAVTLARGFLRRTRRQE